MPPTKISIIRKLQALRDAPDENSHPDTLQGYKWGIDAAIREIRQIMWYQ